MLKQKPSKFDDFFLGLGFQWLCVPLNCLSDITWLSPAVFFLRWGVFWVAAPQVGSQNPTSNPLVGEHGTFWRHTLKPPAVMNRLMGGFFELFPFRSTFSNSAGGAYGHQPPGVAF